MRKLPLNKCPISVVKITTGIIRYILHFIPISIIIMLLWDLIISDSLYYCSDKIPFFDFFPPFVHERVGNIVITSGDYFLVNEKLVYAFWFFLLSLMFLIPYYLVGRISTKNKAK